MASERTGARENRRKKQEQTHRVCKTVRGERNSCVAWLPTYRRWWRRSHRLVNRLPLTVLAMAKVRTALKKVVSTRWAKAARPTGQQCALIQRGRRKGNAISTTSRPYAVCHHIRQHGCRELSLIVLLIALHSRFSRCVSCVRSRRTSLSPSFRFTLFVRTCACTPTTLSVFLGLFLCSSLCRFLFLFGSPH